jgi:predicted enzyme related to lactoylglutathione lyase
MDTNPPNLVANIGGVFIYSEQPAALADWYKKHLGINYEHTPEYNAWYASFEYTDMRTGKKAYTAWSILLSNNRPKFEGKVFSVNYRVYNLEEMVDYLKVSNIEVKGIEEYPEGKFAWLTDPDGNHIELWEDTKMGG